MSNHQSSFNYLYEQLRLAGESPIQASQHLQEAVQTTDDETRAARVAYGDAPHLNLVLDPIDFIMPRTEFNPTSERHHPLLIIKAVEPGCTTELQIEIVQTGEVRRFTTTDNADADDTQFAEEVGKAWLDAWKLYLS